MRFFPLNFTQPMNMPDIRMQQQMPMQQMPMQQMPMQQMPMQQMPVQQMPVQQMEMVAQAELPQTYVQAQTISQQQMYAQAQTLLEPQTYAQVRALALPQTYAATYARTYQLVERIRGLIDPRALYEGIGEIGRPVL